LFYHYHIFLLQVDTFLFAKPVLTITCTEGFIHFFVEQNQGLFKDFPGQKLQFSSIFF
jgi:hypothetical protein